MTLEKAKMRTPRGEIEIEVGPIDTGGFFAHAFAPWRGSVFACSTDKHTALLEVAFLVLKPFRKRTPLLLGIYACDHESMRRWTAGWALASDAQRNLWLDELFGAL